MFSLQFNNRSPVTEDAGKIILGGVVGAGIGYVSALIQKTNVFASTIIFASYGCSLKAVDVFVDMFLGRYTRDGRITKAAGHFLAMTITVSAMRKFDLIGNIGAALCGTLSFAWFGYQLYQILTNSPTITEQLQKGFRQGLDTVEASIKQKFGKTPPTDEVVVVELNNVIS